MGVPPGGSAGGVSPSRDRDQDRDKPRMGKKDRRPLDPPPVAEMKIYEVFEVGTDREWEVPVSAS